MTSSLRPLVLAHRGARSVAPENTLIAFERGFALGADGLELDVTLSADLVPVVIHDSTLERTTDGKGPVHRHPLAALQKFDAGRWFDPAFAGARIPTLAEVFEAFSGRALINVELKSGSGSRGLVERVLAVIGKPRLNQVLISSFSPWLLRETRQQEPRVRLGLLTAMRPGPLGRAIAGPVAAWHPNHRAIDAGLIEAAHRQGIEINVWTVNDEDDLRRVTALGVDGIITDVPDRALAARATKG